MNRRAVFKNLLALPAVPVIAEQIERERVNAEEKIRKSLEDHNRRFEPGRMVIDREEFGTVYRWVTPIGAQRLTIKLPE